MQKRVYGEVISFVVTSILISLVVFAEGCSENRSLPHPVLPTAMGESTPVGVSGAVLGTLSKRPIAGVNITIGAYSTTTDVQGYFQIDKIPAESLLITISGQRIYPRRVSLPFPWPSIVELDVIEQDSEFHLGFYRELVRGNHPTEKDLLPSHRWTVSDVPTFYLDTNTSAVYADSITPQTISSVQDVITRILPVFSGNTYSTASMEVRDFSRYSFDELPENSIVISYDDTLYARGGVGLTITEPDLVSTNAYSITKAWIFLINHDAFYVASGFSRQSLLAHELGHAFGYRHTSLLPSIMKKFGAYQADLFSKEDQLHMTVMYARPPGNEDIDNDPILPASTMHGFPSRQGWFEGISRENANLLLKGISVNGLQSLISEETLGDFDDILWLD